MDYKLSCLIFGFTEDTIIDHKLLKKRYYKLALLYHPDKNTNNQNIQEQENNTKKFQELYEAYEFLCNYLNVNIDEDDNNLNKSDNSYEYYFNKFKTFLSTEYNIDIQYINIINECKTLSFKIFESLDKKTALNLYNYMEEYSNIDIIEKDIYNKLREILKNKIKNEHKITLKSTLENLFNGDTYKLEYNDCIFYIPLWHDEITYDLIDDNVLIVKCIPDFPEYINLDDNNNSHIHINVCLSTLFDREYISFSLYENKNFDIPIKNLHIIKTQIYTFYNMGIPIINTKNIFCKNKKGDVHFHITIV